MPRSLPQQRHHQPTPDLGLKPGRLRGHDAVLAANLDELVNGDRGKGHCEVVAASVDLGSEVGGIPVAPHEGEFLGTRILDLEHAGKEMPLQDVGIDGLIIDEADSADLDTITLPCIATATTMKNLNDRIRLAQSVLDFAERLDSRRGDARNGTVS